MANRKKTQVDSEYGKAPETLDGHPFYGLDVSDPEQIAFRDALWDPKNKFIGISACAGSGKTTTALAVGCLLCHYGRMDNLIYLRVPTSISEARCGYLPGSLQEKVKYYMSPLYNTLVKLGENPFTVVNDDTMINQKNGTGFITPAVDVYLRGDNITRSVVFVDEAQNATEDQLRTIITRCEDSCLVILAGSMRQIDLVNKEDSGFEKCMRHFEGKPWAWVGSLHRNYRGELSEWADLPWEE